MENDYYPDGGSPKDYFYPIMIIIVFIGIFLCIITKN